MTGDEPIGDAMIMRRRATTPKHVHAQLDKRKPVDMLDDPARGRARNAGSLQLDRSSYRMPP